MDAMYRGNNYLWWKRKFMWGTDKYAPMHSYPFISFLIPALTIIVIGVFMGPVGGAIWGVLGTIYIIVSTVLFFMVAALDPGMNPARRFSAHSKHCSFDDFKYRAHFVSSGFLQYSTLWYCAYWFGIQPSLTSHWIECDQCIRYRYCHSTIFLKCIGQRNMHYYMWWLFSEWQKYFFMLIISSAGMAFNIWAGLTFFFFNLGFLIGYSILFILGI